MTIFIFSFLLSVQFDGVCLERFATSLPASRPGMIQVAPSSNALFLVCSTSKPAIGFRQLFAVARDHHVEAPTIVAMSVCVSQIDTQTHGVHINYQTQYAFDK